LPQQIKKTRQRPQPARQLASLDNSPATRQLDGLIKAENTDLRRIGSKRKL